MPPGATRGFHIVQLVLKNQVHGWPQVGVLQLASQRHCCCCPCRLPRTATAAAAMAGWTTALTMPELRVYLH